MANHKSSIEDRKPVLSAVEGSKKVWHITDFDEVFKLPDDVRKGRKGPLSYTKSFVSLSGQSTPPETHHYERLKSLKAHPDRHLLRSIFEDLKNWAGHKTQSHQGYLVDSEGRPADNDYICAQLDHLNKTDLKKAIITLSKIGLIERVALNGQLKPENDNKEKKKRDSKSENKVCPDGSGKGRKCSGKGRPPLNKLKRKVGIDKVKDEVKVGLSAEGKAKDIRNSQDKEKSSHQTSTTPATTPPIKPTISDEGGSVKVIPFAGPPGSVNIADPMHISHAAETVRRRFNRPAHNAAAEIYLALGGKWPPDDSRETARDIGLFKAAFEKVEASKLPAETKTELWDSLIREAERLRKVYKKTGGYKSAKCVWCKPVFKDKLAAAAARSPP